MSIFVIGDRPTVLGFGLVGIPGEWVRDRDEALHSFRQSLKKKDLKLLLITEDWSASMGEELHERKLSPDRPLIVEIPSEARPGEKESIRRQVEKSVGMQLGSGG